MADSVTVIRAEALDTAIASLDAVKATTLAAAAVVQEVGRTLVGVTAQETSVVDGAITVTGLSIGTGGSVLVSSRAFMEGTVPITAYLFKGIV